MVIGTLSLSLLPQENFQQNGAWKPHPSTQGTLCLNKPTSLLGLEYSPQEPAMPQPLHYNMPCTPIAAPS